MQTPWHDGVVAPWKNTFQLERILFPKSLSHLHSLVQLVGAPSTIHFWPWPGRVLYYLKYLQYLCYLSNILKSIYLLFWNKIKCNILITNFEINVANIWNSCILQIDSLNACLQPYFDLIEVGHMCDDCYGSLPSYSHTAWTAEDCTVCWLNWWISCWRTCSSNLMKPQNSSLAIAVYYSKIRYSYILLQGSKHWSVTTRWWPISVYGWKRLVANYFSKAH